MDGKVSIKQQKNILFLFELYMFDVAEPLANSIQVDFCRNAFNNFLSMC